MSACKYGLPVLDQKIVEVDSTPDFSKYKPIVILKREELAKLLMLLEAMKEPWIAMKFIYYLRPPLQYRKNVK